ncbi:hypothetical protein FZC78_03090 [Rossellomorea vietnamensis]|uniref:Zinc-finger domain-containing protein n=1 Tax=Rossellomorea vietnamensis TaxID=218284 RepID=A0A5D4NXC0_9BACI|nr:hypothetical protein [Rossellomorea vietnamensis]TYS18539.1 hypothetical protein FZC78_03090 [Rossellomorea vietnamensis]
MSDQEKIHQLCKELIPLMEDVDLQTKEILINHIQDCRTCQQYYNKMNKFSESFSTEHASEEVEIPPLKKLVQFNTGLKTLLIGVRVVILFYLILSSQNFADEISINLTTIHHVEAGIFLFYFPAAIFLTIFTFTFFNKKWSLISVGADVLVIILTPIFLSWLFN